MSSIEHEAHIFHLETCPATQVGIFLGIKKQEKKAYRGYNFDFALYGIDVEDAEKKFDVAVRSSDYVADLIAVCSVQSYYLIAADFLKLSRHL